MTRHPFRFGVNVYGADTRDEWIAKAQRIEALGYDTFFVADHIMDPIIWTINQPENRTHHV